MFRIITENHHNYFVLWDSDRDDVARERNRIIDKYLPQKLAPKQRVEASHTPHFYFTIKSKCFDSETNTGAVLIRPETEAHLNVFFDLSTKLLIAHCDVILLETWVNYTYSYYLLSLKVLVKMQSENLHGCPGAPFILEPFFEVIFQDPQIISCSSKIQLEYQCTLR